MSIFVHESMTNAEIIRAAYGCESLPVEILSRRLSETDDQLQELQEKLDELQEKIDKLIAAADRTIPNAVEFLADSERFELADDVTDVLEQIREMDE
jgi:peptidoglycan hydrolase CwlO-like protein